MSLEEHFTPAREVSALQCHERAFFQYAPCLGPLLRHTPQVLQQESPANTAGYWALCDFPHDDDPPTPPRESFALSYDVEYRDPGHNDAIHSHASRDTLRDSVEELIHAIDQGHAANDECAHNMQRELESVVSQKHDVQTERAALHVARNVLQRQLDEVRRAQASLKEMRCVREEPQTVWNSWFCSQDKHAGATDEQMILEASETEVGVPFLVTTDVMVAGPDIAPDGLELEALTKRFPSNDVLKSTEVSVRRDPRRMGGG